MDFDTIAAISTPPGEGAIAIIRLSGDEAIQIADRIFLCQKNGLMMQKVIPFSMVI